MIGIKDIERILIGEAQTLIVPSSVFSAEDMPDGVITEERIVIICKERTMETIFDKCFVEVNWCVPNLGDAPDSERLREVERIMLGAFDSVGEYDGTHYKYGIFSEGVVPSELKCHYVNLRLLFEILNVN